MNHLFSASVLAGSKALLTLFNSCSEAPNQQPNILFIIADDLGYEMLGAYGNPNPLTPNLDKMAEEGILFERAYASPVCTPSRVSFYTGYYPVSHGFTNVIPVHVGRKDKVDFDEWTTYAVKLRELGYHTAVTGKWQLAPLEYFPEHCREGGFDSWCIWQIWKDGEKTTRYWDATYNHDGNIREDAKDRFGPDMLTEYVINEMAKASERNQPFCVHHNMVLPHVPIVQTPLDKELGREGSLDNMIWYMDLQIGKLLNAVDSLGLSDNTIIIFVGDNGTQARDARKINDGWVTGGKWSLTDGGTHVPLIIKWDGRISPGKRASSLIDITDIYATLCELGGVPESRYKNVDAISFSNILFGEGDYQNRDYVTGGINGRHFVFDGQWRFLSQDSSLIDGRFLPLEQPADMTEEIAKEAHERLLGIWDALQN